jgi:hypothetical protein
MPTRTDRRIGCPEREGYVLSAAIEFTFCDFHGVQGISSTFTLPMDAASTPLGVRCVHYVTARTVAATCTGLIAAP